MSGNVHVPEVLKDLGQSSSAIMSFGERASFSLISPVGMIIMTDRPIFRWEPLPVADGYQVVVADAADYHEVAVSPEVRQTVWRVDDVLARGRIYTWQVTARTPNGELKAPSPGAGEAKFKVLEAEKAVEIARAERQYAGSHLLLGLVYAEAGLLHQAEREFQALVADNPQSSVAKNLVLAVHARP